MLHFHWSQNNSKGSIHAVDGEKYPLEMHVVYFKAKYIYYEEAAKYEDGLIFEVHFFYIQEDINDSLSPLIEKLSDVHRSGTSVAVVKSALARYVTIFVSDYFLYCGTIMDGKDRHRVTWIICRHPSGVSNSQMNEFRQLLGPDGFPLIRNSQKIYKIGNRKIYHVNGSDYFTEILYPFPKILPKKTEKLRIRFRFKPSNKTNKPTDNEQSKRKEEMKINPYLHVIEDKANNKKIINNKRKLENLNEKQKQYFEPALRRRNVINSVVHWLHNSVVQNKEEMTSLYETTEIEKEECSLEKSSATQATSTNICDALTEMKKNIPGVIKNKKPWSDDYSIDLTPSIKSTDFQSALPKPEDTFFKSNFNVGIIKNKTHKRNKVKLFSDLDSNFTQQLMNKNKLESDGIRVTNAHQNVLCTKSVGTIKKKLTKINSKHVNLEHHKKETDKEQEIKLREGNDHPRSSEALTRSLLRGFKNMYLKYKNDFDNRNSSNITNKSLLKNDYKKENKVSSSETKETSKDFSFEIINYDHQSVRGKKNHFDREKSNIKTDNENNSDGEYSQSSVSFTNGSCDKLYYIQQQEKKKIKSDHKKLAQKIDFLTPLKLDFDFLPDNFEVINEPNGRKHQPRKKRQQLKEAGFVCNDSIRKKHKRTQTLKILKSSSSEPKNIFYISNHPKKRVTLRGASDTSKEKKVKFKKRKKKYPNYKIDTQYKKVTRNDFKVSENKEKHTFSNVKVKKTSSHESLYIFIKKSIDNVADAANLDTKKKPGMLYEWLLSAKDLLTGPR
ncbi:uncharacterized protein [Halyomorpha halys]|uniref:uncharacterized protein isoform X1 n=3 Tax=Halyomorpha halys TaxID=286706 RepID=UPI0034D27579